MKTALQNLLKVRKAGFKPSMVLLTLYPADQPLWWRVARPITEIVVDENPALHDFRPLLGCDVLIATDEIESRTRAVIRKALNYASTVVVFVTDGSKAMTWDRKLGWGGDVDG